MLSVSACACSLSSIDSRIQVILAALHEATANIAGQANPGVSHSSSEALAAVDGLDSATAGTPRLAASHVPVTWRIVEEHDEPEDASVTQDVEGMMRDARLDDPSLRFRQQLYGGGTEAENPEEWMLLPGGRILSGGRMALDSNRPSDWWRNRPAGGGFEPTNALSQIISYCESRLANDDPEDNDIGARQGARRASNAADAISPANEQRNHSPPEPPEPLSRPLPSRPSRPALRLQQPGADQAESGCEQPGSVFEWSGYHSSVTPTYRILPTFGNRARPLPPTPISENDDLADSSPQASRAFQRENLPEAASRLRAQLQVCDSRTVKSSGDHDVEQFRTLFTDEVHHYQVPDNCISDFTCPNHH
jgi:hypothetical protein